MLEPRAPWWIEMSPRPDEKFGDFWIRVGLTIDDIVHALADINDHRAVDVANDRLAQTWAERFPQIFDRRKQKWLASGGF